MGIAETLSRDLLTLMEQLNELEGTTFLLPTHYLRMMDLTRRLIEVSDGRILAGTPQSAASLLSIL